MNNANRATLEGVLGYRFREPRWLVRALTHSSRRPELEAEDAGDNERLEFLGDAVVGLVVSQFLLQAFPAWREGELSKSKARLVSGPALSRAAQRLELGGYLQLGRGEEKTGGRQKRAVLADAYEAVVAAIYVDGGLKPAADFVRRSLLEDAVREYGEALGQLDHKSALQELLQARGFRPAEYRVIRETGPEHRKRFRIEVSVRGRAMATCEGNSKKEAEQAAARLVLEQLRGSAESS
jgi:ribonuclease-3